MCIRDSIETDQLDGEAGSYGLYKQPTKDVVPFVDGSRDVTEYYYLLARQSSKAEASRVDNQAWMESVSYTHLGSITAAATPPCRPSRSLPD